MKQYIVLLLMLVARDQIFAQKLHFMPRVNTPDSIGEKESLAYDTELDSYSKKGWPTYNMLYPKKYSYGNGIYIYINILVTIIHQRFLSTIIPGFIFLNILVVLILVILFMNIQNALIN